MQFVFREAHGPAGTLGLQVEAIKHQAPGLRPSTGSERDLLVFDSVHCVQMVSPLGAIFPG